MCECGFFFVCKWGIHGGWVTSLKPVVIGGEWSGYSWTRSPLYHSLNKKIAPGCYGNVTEQVPVVKTNKCNLYWLHSLFKFYLKIYNIYIYIYVAVADLISNRSEEMLMLHLCFSWQVQISAIKKSLFMLITWRFSNKLWCYIWGYALVCNRQICPKHFCILPKIPTVNMCWILY